MTPPVQQTCTQLLGATLPCKISRLPCSVPESLYESKGKGNIKSKKAKKQAIEVPTSDAGTLPSAKERKKVTKQVDPLDMPG
jgi:hypothetical protein